MPLKSFKTKNRTLPDLIDYMVRIPPGGRTDALCETIITWKTETREMKTRGWIPTKRYLQ